MFLYLNYILVFVASYLIGSINSSIIVSKVMGTDIREHGSGNAGATNTLRTLGKKAAILVLVVDVLKAVIAVLIGSFIDSPGFYPQGMMIASLGAVLGHNFPVYFGFRGGKGVLVSITSIFFIDWRAGLIVLTFALIIMATTKFVSLGSILGSVLYPFVVLVLYSVADKDIKGIEYYLIFSILISISSIFMHRTNIVKLLKGTESKLGSKKRV